VYLLLKTVHLFAVVAFLGNISVGLFWKAAADRTGNPAIIMHTVRSIILADRLITIPSIIVLFAAGVLFAIAGLAFAPLSSTQVRLAEAAAQMPTEPTARGRYEQLSGARNFWGLIALGAPIVVLVLMVFKPDLPALP
jgi:uncharacterized membrane protein